MRTRISVAAAIVVAAAIAAGIVAAGQTARSAAARYRGTIAFVRVDGALYVIHADGSGLRRVTPRGIDVSDYAWSPDARRIAFVRVDGALYVIHADGSGLRRVTPPGMDVSDYAWSPDARRIAYIDRGGSLWLVRPDGEGRKRLLAGSITLASSALSWSPNGRTIAITSRGAMGSCAGKQIYVVPIDGASPRKVRGASPACDLFAWSPRGNLIAYSDTDGHGFWVVHPDGSGRRRVSSQGGAGWVRWSADGNQLAFAVAIRKRNRWHHLHGGIAVVDVDGRGFHIVTRHANNENPAVWSPTGHRLLYGRWNHGGIYVIGAKGRSDRRVTTESSDALAWSPDGGAIIYATSTGGLDEVGIDGRGKVQLTSPGTGDFDPSWVGR